MSPTSKSSSIKCHKYHPSDQVIMCSELGPLQIILLFSILCAIAWHKEDWIVYLPIIPLVI